MYEGGLRVPAMVVWPGVIEPGSASDYPALTMDIYPTLLELTGLKPDPKLEGNSLVPLLKNPEANWPHYARTSFGPGNYAIVSERFRFIQYNDGSEEFYDLSKDSHEWNNVVKNPEYAEAVKQHRLQIPQDRHPILGKRSTGHQSYSASEALKK